MAPRPPLTFNDDSSKKSKSHPVDAHRSTTPGAHTSTPMTNANASADKSGTVSQEAMQKLVQQSESITSKLHTSSQFLQEAHAVIPVKHQLKAEMMRIEGKHLAGGMVDVEKDTNVMLDLV